MSNRLMIRYNSDDLEHWSWVVLDKDNRPAGKVSSGDLNTLAVAAKGKRTVLVVAGRSVLITAVELPEGNRRVISKAIPYALEEQLAEDVELLHFVAGERQLDGMIPVVAISRQLLADLLQVLSDAGVFPVWAVVEPLLLPWNESELSILVRNDMAIVRNGVVSGFECALDQLPVFMTCSENEQEVDDLPIIRVWEQEQNAGLSHLLQGMSRQLLLEKTLSDFDKLTDLGTKRPGVNLLQGFDQPNLTRDSAGSWWPAIVMFLLAIVLYMGTSGYQYYQVQKELEAVTQKSEGLFRKTFPDVKRLVQPLVQAQQKLDLRRVSHGKGTDDLLALLTILGEARQKNKAIEFKNLEYRQNSLVVYLEGKSVAQIEKFKRQLESGGGTTSDILSTVSKGKKVEARIKLKANST